MKLALSDVAINQSWHHLVHAGFFAFLSEWCNPTLFYVNWYKRKPNLVLCNIGLLKHEITASSTDIHLYFSMLSCKQRPCNNLILHALSPTTSFSKNMENIHNKESSHSYQVPVVLSRCVCCIDMTKLIQWQQNMYWLHTFILK